MKNIWKHFTFLCIDSY